ncbi:imidazole glycerol phosphate synthase subunit HisH [Acuticoccus kandeliae]|uniref:imidazole glycerol phosphate synthase subunit HisH n=1 Tax=Acuticoccus kandeliae TaxID=2073160 RepID=UPI000D3E8639|nr:imidazole glycerol phosphate synthase subunit HisH [Acuticoccus kandeliae]
MSVVIIDYGSGNLRSAEKAFERAASERNLKDAIVVSSDPMRVARADRIVLPGVGAFADCMTGLASTTGMVEALKEAVLRRGVPLLGVCVGMQLFATRGLEHVETEGLDFIPGVVSAIEVDDPALKIPHMGWNVLEEVNAHPVMKGIPLGPDGLHAYFVHSYAIRPNSSDDLVATTDHGETFAAIVGRDNIVGTQFHPEKSQTLGLALIGNFLTWTP